MEAGQVRVMAEEGGGCKWEGENGEAWGAGEQKCVSKKEEPITMQQYGQDACMRTPGWGWRG